MKSDHENAAQVARKAMMATLARAPAAEFRRLWSDAGFAADAETLRGPETGLVTVRGRIGGGGAPFNVGEATVTRATVRLSGGEIGHAYALGRDHETVRLAAIVDALWQKAELRAALQARIVAPLAAALDAADRTAAAETAATKVDFFTLVRGED